ncbi:MAG TPA: metalloregulator ArsR/SmtB family transcription factor [Anaerolineales bacterium]|jgi:ArsR family transcriptional regulator|nr:metalloregulator ArsR/SmtB family transcription factor [Anaerolineales bacterium]
MNTSQLSREVTQLHADLCSGLADPKRLLLLYSLSERPRTVNDLASELGLTQPATSRHLKVLRDRGLVNATRHGAHVEYSLDDHRLIEALDLLRTVLHDSVTRRANLIIHDLSVETG